jgi:S1-C subfamily serine protease
VPINFPDTLSASVARIQTRWAGWVSGFAVGSGVVVTVDYVATSLGSPGQAATVCALNDESWEGRVSVVDPGHGIALIEGVEGLPGLRLADSPAAAPPGAEIALLGYTPFGWRSSAGTIVGTAQSSASKVVEPFLQAELQAERGQGGGPVINRAGEVIGLDYEESGPGLELLLPGWIAREGVERFGTSRRPDI